MYVFPTKLTNNYHNNLIYSVFLYQTIFIQYKKLNKYTCCSYSYYIYFKNLTKRHPICIKLKSTNKYSTTYKHTLCSHYVSPNIFIRVNRVVSCFNHNAHKSGT